MSKKNKKKEQKPETKKLLSSQAELLRIKIQALNQVSQVMEQRKNDINNSIVVACLEQGIPEDQVGEWGLSQDGMNLIRVGKQKRPPGVIKTTVKKRDKKKKKKGENQPPEEEG